MSWKLLERFVSSEIFGNDPSICVAYLSRYSNHVGIQYVLCNKLRSFSYAEIEFFLPQLCHLLVSIDSESMALEEFIVDLCHESVSGALITFWLFQAATFDLRNDPQSTSFRTCRRLYNKIQQIVFNASDPPKPAKIRENILPTTVLSSIVLASIAVPLLPSALGPLAIAQARRPRPADETISETPQVQSRLNRSQTVSQGSGKVGKRRSTHSRANSKEGPARSTTLPNDNIAPTQAQSRPASKDSTTPKKLPSHIRRPSGPYNVRNGSTISSSLSDIVSPMPPSDQQAFPFPSMRPGLEEKRRHSHTPAATFYANMTTKEKSNLLRAHYFRSETAFLQALERISNQLVALPKPARLSALRAELALIARDLPAEVDIPVLCPATLEDGLPSKSKHHRVVRLNPAEATSLNSAERVPYLLIVEVIRDDFDFNPESEANQKLLATLANPKVMKKRLFDTCAAQTLPLEADSNNAIDSVFEPAMGDLSSSDLLHDSTNNPGAIPRPDSRPALVGTVSGGVRSLGSRTPPRLSSGANTISSYSMLSTPRTSDIPLSRSDSPTPRIGLGKENQPDFSALATHMRTAAQMLAQLDISSSKRPRAEVEAIKSKIIANMRTLEEQNFNIDDDVPNPTFEAMLAENMKSPGKDTLTTPLTDGSLTPEPRDTTDPTLPPSRADPSHDTAAGIARTENDQKTGGLALRRKSDREDPSYALFGEDWASKKERIRRSSPWGFHRSWDLLSMIVKTGSDLRQELFACQMIRVCSGIWRAAGVKVWVRNMRILVTGESAGLIETITNGVSLHSLKRSLTLHGIAQGTNPRRRFATLKDHFVRAFGPDESSPPYVAAQRAFASSLAAYSVLSYVLQLKDRHNGNILVDHEGHVVHIDFGFMLSNSPGSMGFEAAPFKLTAEYVEVLGGTAGAPAFELFRALCKEAFIALRRAADQIVSLVDLMGQDSRMACFQGSSAGPAQVSASLRARFVLQLSSSEAEAYVDELIQKSLGSYYTRLYDVFQYRTQGIY